MKAQSIYKYVFIGTIIRYLQDAQDSFGVFSDGGILENINNFLSSLDELNMQVTSRYSEELRLLRDKFIEELESQPNLSRSLTKEEAVELRNLMSKIRDVFSAEVEGVFAFITSEKRYDINRLLNNISLIFSPDTFNKLPEIAKYDFQEAGRCIAFERPTAAAFHILRATEDVLRIYYKKYIRKDPSIKNWGVLTNELKNKNRGKKPEKVTINHLDNIRESFRNPTQHPDKIYDIQEVQDLLGLSIDIVNRMIKK